MLRTLNLATKICILVAIAVIATAGATWFVASEQIWSKLEEQQREKAEQYLRSLTLVFAERFPGVQAKVVDGRVVRIESPDLANYSDFSVVDASVSYVGGNATIFTYDREQDKFIRRVTTVKKENGERAVGTELTASSPALPVVRRGGVYQGPVTLFGKRFETVYQPTFDAAGQVNGILYVGVPVEAFFTAYSDTMWAMSLAAGLIALLSCGGAAFTASCLFRPLRTLCGRIDRLTQGDLETPIAYQQRGDEIGAIARALTVFKDALSAKRAADEAAVAEVEAKARRALVLDETTRAFEGQVGSLTRALATAATEMEATARSMTATADQAERQSGIVAGAAQETSANVQTVAAATEELAASVQEIAAQVAHSSQIAGQAVSDAHRTSEIVQVLSASVAKIDAVATLINSIAGQTNLLALNATIEAARAGQAGRGFAVVATEVKALADQTARATEEIGGQISQVQAATREAVAAITAVSRTIAEVSAIANSIAAAVEEQGAATREIARNVQEAAQGTGHVSENIKQVREGAGQTGAAAFQVLSAAQELARRSEGLTQEVSAFLASVKAA